MVAGDGSAETIKMLNTNFTDFEKSSRQRNGHFRYRSFWKWIFWVFSIMNTKLVTGVDFVSVRLNGRPKSSYLNYGSKTPRFEDKSS